MPVDPDAADFIEKAAAAGHRQMGQLTLEEMRAAVADVIPLGFDREDVAAVEDHGIAVDGGTIRVRVFTPDNAGDMPVVVWLHGGSFTRCGLDSHDALWRRFANRSGCVVLGVEFRLAPEAQYPVPLEDCYAATLWASRQRMRFPGNGRLVVAGESSGGVLTTATAILARERRAPVIDGLLLLIPMLDRDSGTPSRRELASDYLLTDAQIQWAYEQYAPGASPDDPLVYPYRVADVADLPTTRVVTVEYDPLRDEGERFADRLLQAGVDARSVRIPGLIHPALLLPKAIPAAAEVLDTAAAVTVEAFRAALIDDQARI